MTRFRLLCRAVSVIMSVLMIAVMLSSCSIGSNGSGKEAPPTTSTTHKAGTDPNFSFDKMYYAEKSSLKDSPGNYSLVIYKTEDNSRIVEMMPSFKFSKITWDDKEYKVTVSNADGSKSESYIYVENRWVKSALK